MSIPNQVGIEFIMLILYDTSKKGGQLQKRWEKQLIVFWTLKDEVPKARTPDG
jgi:hypothetical protein